MEDRGLTVIIPAYNEEESIGFVVDEVKKYLEQEEINYEILVVDDGSTDNTAAVARRHEATIIRHETNRGYGRAIKSGAKKSKFNYIAIIDGDGSYPASEIPQLFRELLNGDYDIILGERKGRQPLLRIIAKFFISRLANFIAGKKLPDINTGLRIFKKQVLEDLELLLPDGFSFTATLTLACSIYDYRIGAKRIEFHQRRGGKSKIKPLSSFANFVMLILRMALLFKPLKIFLPLALIQGLVGLIIGVYFVITMFNIPDSCLLLLLSAMQTALLGMVADILAFERHQLFRSRLES